MKLIALKPMRYATRRLRAGDPFTATHRDARVLVAFKRATAAPAIKPNTRLPSDDSDIESARADYHRAIGRRPYHRWDVATLREKIREHSAANPNDEA